MVNMLRMLKIWLNQGKNDMTDYFSITESAGGMATKEQLRRIFQRYNFAKYLSPGKDILEVACGSGLGLGYLAAIAKSVTGVDIDEKNVAAARGYYKKRNKEARSREVKTGAEISIAIGDAHKLEFPDKSFDIVLLFEAIYYLKDPASFLAEASRVLRANGKIIICTVNKDWEDFHPSPYTHGYFSVPELAEFLKDGFIDLSFYGGFSPQAVGARDKIISVIKRMAVKFDLIPGSLKARAYLKRLFMGKLVPLPAEIYEGMAPYEDPVKISCDKECKEYKIIYAVAGKRVDGE